MLKLLVVWMVLFLTLPLCAYGKFAVVERNTDTPVALVLDDKPFNVSPSPILRKGRVYVPVTIFRKIGLSVLSQSPREATVGWPESDAIIDYRAGISTHRSGVSDDKPIPLPGTPFMHRGVLMVPLRSWINGTITSKWDANAGIVYLYRNMDWLRWRIAADEEYAKHPEWGYSRVWLGKYIPSSPESEIEKAKKLRDMGNSRQAVRILESLVNAKPFDWRSDLSRTEPEWKAYKPLGEMLTPEGFYPGDTNYYLGIGLALEGDFAGAEAEFRKAAERNKNDSMYEFAIGWAIIRGNKEPYSVKQSPEPMVEALGHYEKSLELNASYEPAIRNAAWTSLALAYLVEYAGGYSDVSRIEALPYLRKSVDYFERLEDRAGTNATLKYYISETRKQLKHSEELAAKQQATPSQPLGQ